jgi:hypothetical protein
MKKKLQSLCAALLLSSALWLHAAETTTPPTPPVIKHSAEFERMKTLVGTWAGKMDMGQGPMEFSIQYRLIAAGSVVEERCFIGTPNEMVSMYYDDGGKLAMTHYCMMGNRPSMTAKSVDAKTISFDFNAACCTIDAKKESHMHAMTVRFDDPNTITTSCKAIMDGKELPEHATTLKRVEVKTAAK